MRRLADALHWIAVALWAGALWTVGLLVVPTLLRILDADRALAGRIAGDLYTQLAWLGFACAGYLLVFRLARFGGGAFRQPAFWVVIAMFALGLTGQFFVQPILSGLAERAALRQIVEAVYLQRFATWHGVSVALYGAQSLLAVALVLTQRNGLR